MGQSDRCPPSRCSGPHPLEEQIIWTILQAESQREHIARLLLMRSNYTTYLPRIKTRSRIAPLFPGYLFVELNGPRWYSILRTPHVVRILMSGDQPAKVPDGLLELIRKQEHEGLVKLPQLARQLRKGQKIKVLRGSFEGKIGLYEGMSGKHRERVLLQLLGQAVLVTLPTNDITPLQHLA